MSAPYEACGGCGAQTPAERCIGCLHDFGDGPLFPSQTPEAAGLKVVARVYSTIGGELKAIMEQHDRFMSGEPLVTAASAQAAIDAEKAKVAELERQVKEAKGASDAALREWDGLIARTHAAEARADRLAKALERAKRVLDNTAITNALRMVGAYEILDTALQQETQP